MTRPRNRYRHRLPVAMPLVVAMAAFAWAQEIISLPVTTQPASAPAAAPAPIVVPAQSQPAGAVVLQAASQPASAPIAATTAPAPSPLAALRAELETARRLVSPTDPLWVRFTLTNPTDETVQLPGSAIGTTTWAAGLPQELIFGSTATPALQLLFSEERPASLFPSNYTAGASGAGLTIAPRSSIGTEINLRPLRKELRYSGTYELVWKPAGGDIPPATLEFRVEQRMQARLITDYGPVTFSLEYEKAPKNVENFLELARTRFYDNTPFRRVLPGMMLQGGAPGGDPQAARPDGKRVEAEIHDAPIEAGTLAMALKGGDRNSASCQFFIALGRLPDLDGKYTVIGRARDDASLRTLRQMSSVETDPQNRPLHPLVVRFFTLVAEEGPQVQRFEVAPTGDGH